MKILAAKLRAIGDTVIWTSALNALRAEYPQARIHSLTYALNAAVLENHGAIDEQHYISDPSSRLELIRVLRGFRSERFDWLLGFHATTSLCRWSWLAGARRRALHHHSWTYTPRGSVPIPEPGRLEDVITRDHRVLEAVRAQERGPIGLGRPTTVNSHSSTSLCVLPGERDWAERLLRSKIAELGGSLERPRFVFLPGGSYALKRYPRDLLIPLMSRVKAEGRWEPYVLADVALSREWDLKKTCRDLRIPLFDDISLRQVMALISCARRALANDSAPGHIAVALGIATDFVFGPGCPGDFHPYDRVLHPLHWMPVDCRADGPRNREEFQFCTLRECAHHKCMRSLNLETRAF